MGRKSKTKEKEPEEGVENVTMEDQELSYDEKLKYVSVIAKPMATKSQAKRLYRLIKKASKEKGYIRSGLKDVQRRIRLGERGLCVFAGNVTPIDVICHMPAVCEDKSIPYCYTPSRVDLGAAMGVKRGSVMILVKPHASYQELYDEIYSELKAMPVPAGDNLYLPQEKL
uniref:Putative NHP2 protein n=1 Tax=Embidopsocus sp. OG15828 TaxID=2530242 RepID=A0A481SXR8_9NEOP|nr:putative NHP2 protein [Embidopsocus sp. OG15828]